MELDALKVDHAALDETADDLTRIVTRIDARMGRLDADLAPLRTSWVGDAQHSYAVAKQRWDAAIHEMRDLLHDTSRQVAASNADYRAADARGARAFEL